MASETSYRRRIPAGLVDSAFASLATFVTSLAAVNLLDDVSRGTYAVYFTAFLGGTVIALNLVFTPAAVKGVSYGSGRHLASFSQGLRLGIAPGIVGSLAALIAHAATSSYTDPEVAFAFTVTTAVAIVLSPMQDHVRKMLHIASRSWRAAIVSIVQFVVASAAVGLAILIDAPVAWIPFGALSLANLVSLATGWLLGYLVERDQDTDILRLRELFIQGKWLVAQASVGAIATFAVAVIVAELADPETLGFAESARVVAQPVIVLAFGLTAVLAPRSMRAAMDTDGVIARHTTRVFLGLLIGGSLLYVAIAGWDWVLNPMSYIVPSAYEVQGLVAVTAIANIFAAAWILQNNEMLGAAKERSMFWITLTSAPIQLAVAGTAGVTGAFARPLATIAGIATRYGLQYRVLRPMYDAAEHGDSEPTDEQPMVEPTGNA